MMIKKNKRRGVVEKREDFVLGCKKIEKSRIKYCETTKVLAIDPSLSSTGWCSISHLSSGYDIKTGALVPTVWGFARYVWIEREIRKLLEKWSTRPFCGIEGYAYNSKWGREQAGELGGIIRRIFFLKKCPLLVVSPLSIKAWLKAKQKSHIMLEILDQYKKKISNEDAADAFVLADIIKSVLLLSKVVVNNNISSSQVAKFMKAEKYKKVKSIKYLKAHQMKTLFNLISDHGEECAFFEIEHKAITTLPVTKTVLLRGKRT